ncbi:MAG: DNA primase [Lachnospiraceae bacterium]|jgi:DNA primase|nr:DNA primase [Lachnospiraceae bacterium]
MYYPEELVEEVRSRNDIVDVISGYVKLKRQGNSYVGLCPFHNEKSPSFSVSQDKQVYYCFGCGAGGNVFTFLKEYENYSFPEALQVLAQRCGMELPREEYSPEAKRQADRKSLLLQIHKEAAVHYYQLLKQEGGRQAWEYLRGRGLSQETIRRFGLGYSSKYSNELYQFLKKKAYSDELLKESGLIQMDEQRGAYDKFWNRVMFPIMDRNHRVIGFGGRVMGDAKPKYLNSPETPLFDKSRNLYGLNLAKSSRKSNMIICEGYMDVIALHQAGFSQAVASLGTALTEQQCLLLKRYTNEVLITYDSDEAGTKAALRAIPLLKEAGLSARVINMKPYKDPDEFIKNLGVEAFQERMDQASSSFLFEVEVLERSYDLGDPARKTEFFEETARKLLAFTEELERNNYIEAIAKQYGIGYQTLKQLVERRGMALGGVPPVSRPRQSAGRKKERPDGLENAQRLICTWLISDEGMAAAIRRYLKPEEFTEGIYRQVAEKLYEQLDHGSCNPAAVISHFTDTEEQRQVAAMFHTSLKQEGTRAETEKALQEAIRRVKQNSLAAAIEQLDSADMAGLQRLVAKKRELERLHISLD